MIGGESHLNSGLAGGPKQSQLGTAGKGTGRSADTQKSGQNGRLYPNIDGPIIGGAERLH
jgi:hypothetical protein